MQSLRAPVKKVSQRAAKRASSNFVLLFLAGILARATKNCVYMRNTFIDLLILTSSKILFSNSRIWINFTILICEVYARDYSSVKKSRFRFICCNSKKLKTFWDQIKKFHIYMQKSFLFDAIYRAGNRVSYATKSAKDSQTWLHFPFTYTRTLRLYFAKPDFRRSQKFRVLCFFFVPFYTQSKRARSLSKATGIVSFTYPKLFHYQIPIVVRMFHDCTSRFETFRWECWNV